MFQFLVTSFVYGLSFLMGLHSPEHERERLIERVRSENKMTQVVAGRSRNNRAIELYYFPGRTDSTALVVGGVHGSELSSGSVAYELIRQLSSGIQPEYNVWIIPVLFPDNLAVAESRPADIGSLANIGRYTHPKATDPNRQMPGLGQPFNIDVPVDNAGRLIEPENQLLLGIVQQLRPHRVAMLHAIREPSRAGIFADPRTDCHGIALGFGRDSLIAVSMARYIVSHKGLAPGNHLDTRPGCLYHCDPPVAPAGMKQTRNLRGSQLPNGMGSGVSMGSWGSTAVCAGDPAGRRDACILFTVEFPGSRRPEDHRTKVGRLLCQRNVEAYAGALAELFVVRTPAHHQVVVL